MQLRYTAFDFDIRSEIPLPARRVANDAPHLSKLSVLYDETLGECSWTGFDFRMSPYLEFSVVDRDRWMLRCFDDVSGREARLEIDARGVIRAFCRGGCLLGDLGRLVVYQGLTALAFLRGSAVLHGSMFHHADRGFAILGHSGDGKSTTTAALLRAGAGVVAEETLLLREARGGWSVLPGPPYLSLDPTLIARLDERETLPEWERRDGSAEEKVRWRWQMDEVGQQPLEPAPLQAVFVLGRREPGQSGWKSSQLDVPTAVHVLSQHCTWGAQLPPAYRTPSYRAAMQIATSTPVYRLTMPDSLDCLFEQAPRVLRGLCELTPCGATSHV
ncbi:hypothetical protein SAMN05421771_2088 [Granulicella pectinivorans]|uniref:Hpr(Ser) kinase/phosphatase n=1 Tax=Granulicella pectinivorans TaxID=474950 RepID=A0A1I6M981_9BACT|nr:hypothetical protein [Granulicella pectinivorans]SFS12249.1 hypothetical protein SAMN05421771_2088 [Granulicella pectinivorans]